MDALDMNTIDMRINSKQTAQIHSTIAKKTRRRSLSSDYLILLDWDDTICPSTYIISTLDCQFDERCGKIQSFGIKQELKDEFVCNLKKVGSAALKLLNKLLCRFKATNIKIVTNGQKGTFHDN